MVTQSGDTARNFMKRQLDITKPDGTQRYFRFNVAQGLQRVKLDEYRARPMIEAATEKYIETLEQETLVRMCAVNLATK
jgi:pyrroloquinoline quinone (PQQ) biosynthesis protein C